jgi:hypothetical protein
MQEEQNVQNVEESVEGYNDIAPEDQQIEAEKTEEQAEPESASKPYKRNFQGRINQLTAKNRQAQQKVMELEQTLAELENKSKPVSIDPPKREDFDDEDVWIRETSKWSAAEVLREQQLKSQQKKQQAETQQVQTQLKMAIDNLVNKGLDEFEDFNDMVTENPEFAITDAMRVTLAELKNGQKVAYYLGSNPDQIKKIVKLSPVKQALELGKIQDKLITKKTTGASPPISGQKGVSTGAIKKNVSSMTPDEYRKWRYEDLKSRGKGIL